MHGRTLNSITLVGIAFLTLAAVFEKRRETMIGLLDAAVLGYTSAGSAAMSPLTRPLRKRITVVASEYVIDSLLNLLGPMRKFVHKGSGPS